MFYVVTSLGEILNIPAKLIVIEWFDESLIILITRLINRVGCSQEAMLQIKEWNNIYKEVQGLGQYLKDSRPDADGNPPAFTIPLKERREIENHITKLLKRSNAFLRTKGLAAKPPKWLFDIDDETTWVSSPAFAYGHLI